MRAVRAWGLEIWATDPTQYSCSATGVTMPEGYNEAELRAVILQHFEHVLLGAGLGKVAGKIFRIGHLGDFNDLDADGHALRRGEMGLELAGVPYRKGGAAEADGVAGGMTGLREKLEATIEGEVRFGIAVTRALYSTDASVYQIEPLGAVNPKSREDLIRIVRICDEFGCSLTMRGGGTSQAGQAIGAGLQVDTSKYYNQVLELNAEKQWVRVQPGIVLDELNAVLRPHGLRFAPDVSTASRATIGGMIANNSSGARSVLYGKTIDHVIELEVVLADGSVAHLAPGREAPACFETVLRLASECADEIDRRFPKVLRRVGGYNLDEFVPGREPFNPAKIIVGSEGTLAVILEAKLNLVRPPKEKSVLVVQFRELLEALEATPLILRRGPSAVEVMDSFILGHTRPESQPAAATRDLRGR